MRDLTGKVVIVTGAAGGIGRALSRRFCAAGAALALFDLNGAVCFLVSDDAAFITGHVLSVSGGLTMAG